MDVVACDQELRRLRIVARASPDLVERRLARLRIDQLLEQRHRLTRNAEQTAAEGSSPAGAPGS